MFNIFVFAVLTDSEAAELVVGLNILGFMGHIVDIVDPAVILFPLKSQI